MHIVRLGKQRFHSVLLLYATCQKRERTDTKLVFC